MNDSLIKCPHCGQTFEVGDALRHEIALAEQAKFQKELDLARKLELELRLQKNKLEDQQRSFELDKQRQLDIERAQIRQKTMAEAAEKFRLKELEKNKVIADLTRSLEDAQRKATQSSQQLQGEIQELDLENTLRTAFPQDLIESIAKGTLGADIRQTVRSPKGTDCGTILWESKRTKAWSDGWLSKLKSDLVADKSHIPALVSDVLPEELKAGIGSKDGVWLCLPSLFIPLTQLLRKSLLDAARQKAVSLSMQDKSQQLYLYVSSPEFTNQVKFMLETYIEMKAQVGRDRAALEKSLKSRELQVDRLISGMSGIYASMQEVASLPSLSVLELSS